MCKVIDIIIYVEDVICVSAASKAMFPLWIINPHKVNRASFNSRKYIKCISIHFIRFMQRIEFKRKEPNPTKLPVSNTVAHR